MELCIFIAVNIVKPLLFTTLILSVPAAIIIIKGATK